ncbi:hypothetical protein PHMEG_00039705 [Phytophthora megakarya]|uniref:Uncharacterized protein n=1 Tax=Phytophthora megakarya TaxID=4795 RepID=A0A225UF80_9STRA|nr:hypothetical protein PHMEG_00039705 [Phytophthora megakarya]
MIAKFDPSFARARRYGALHAWATRVLNGNGLTIRHIIHRGTKRREDLPVTLWIPVFYFYYAFNNSIFCKWNVAYHIDRPFPATPAERRSMLSKIVARAWDLVDPKTVIEGFKHANWFPIGLIRGRFCTFPLDPPDDTIALAQKKFLHSGPYFTVVLTNYEFYFLF